MENLEWEIKELWDESELLQKDCDGECAVMMLCNNMIVAYMQEAMTQLEDVKKTLNDFKIEVGPDKIPS